jgi:hypothetical protein
MLIEGQSKILNPGFCLFNILQWLVCVMLALLQHSFKNFAYEGVIDLGLKKALRFLAL